MQQTQTPFGTEAKARLVAPGKTIRFDAPSIPQAPPGYGQNPQTGVQLDYFLPKDLDSATVVVQVMDASGKVLRTYSNQKDNSYLKYEGGPAPKVVLPAKKGLNRIAWDMRREVIPGVSKVFVNGDYRGSMVGPGSYTLRLIADKDTSVTTAVLLPDPRLDATPADFAAQQQVLTQTEEAVREIHETVNTLRMAKQQIEALEATWKSDTTMKELLAQGKEVVKKITKWEDKLITPKQQTFQDVINFPNRLNAQLLDLRDRAGTHDPAPTAGVLLRLNELLTEWSVQKAAMQRLVNEDIAQFNATYKAKQVPAVYVGIGK